MDITQIINHIIDLTLFINKNEKELKRVLNTLNDFFNESSQLEDFIIRNDYDVLDTQDYLNIHILDSKNIYEFSFRVGKSRVDILPITGIKRIVIHEDDVTHEGDVLLPPVYMLTLYHDVGTGSSIITEITGQGNEILMIKKFSEKIRKKILTD